MVCAKIVVSPHLVRAASRCVAVATSDLARDGRWRQRVMKDLKAKIQQMNDSSGAAGVRKLQDIVSDVNRSVAAATSPRDVVLFPHALPLSI